MASSTTVLFALLLLHLSSSVSNSSSGSDPQIKHCLHECGGVPEREQKKECMHHCLDHGSDSEKKYCLHECRGIPEGGQKRECVHHCLDRGSDSEKRHCFHECQSVREGHQKLECVHHCLDQVTDLEKKHCLYECRGFPEGYQKKGCVHHCLDRISHSEKKHCLKECKGIPEGHKKQECVHHCLDQEFGLEKKHCLEECQGILEEHQKKKCVHHCLDQGSNTEKKHCLQKCRGIREEHQKQACVDHCLDRGSSPENKKHCFQECRGILQGRQKQECIDQCFDRSSKQEARREQEQEDKMEDDKRERNPYYFGKRSYEHWTRTEHGRFKVLERFAKRSELPMGIENYRLAVLVIDPETITVPSHWDAEQVIYVVEGCGTITFVHEENRESHTVRRGDIMSIPAGAIVYAINKARNDKLRVAMLLHCISTAGQIEEFFGAAGRKPQTFYTSFSDDLSEAAFNTPRAKLERLFGSQRKGEIIKLSEEQMRALNQSTSEGISSRSWPFAQSNEPYNLLKSRPSHSNEHGELHVVSSDNYRPLQNIDMDVSIANISERSMMVPHFNSRSIKLAMVVGGRGYFEMACPHRSNPSETHRREEEREREGHQRVPYQRVRSRVSRGSVFVIPAGHPVVAIAARNEHLQILCFGIHAEHNVKHYLAGRNNVLKRLDRAAMELAFGIRAEEVEEVLNAQRESMFMPGPEHRREEVRGGRQASMLSLLSFAKFWRPCARERERWVW